MLSFTRVLNWSVRHILRYMAKSHGILDPFAILGQVRRFAQPSEVAEPGELLRAGAVMHARGLMNRAIQYNDDWVWPYWAERQFDSFDDAFIPRAFSLTHINLTHRNWTAVGVPDYNSLPLVDPAGLLTPHGDTWSIDAWIVDDEGSLLAPSRLKQPFHEQINDDGPIVHTQSEQNGMRIDTVVRAERMGNQFVCRLTAAARSDRAAWLAICLRPYNPEGIAFVYDIRLNRDGQGWLVNKDEPVHFSEKPDRHATSDYRKGDVSLFVPDYGQTDKVECKVGMATAAALYRIEPGSSRSIDVIVPMCEKTDDHLKHRPTTNAVLGWEDALRDVCRIEIPDPSFQRLYETALHTLILHSPNENVYPGPFIYRRFWFRDAALILNAMLCANMPRRAERVIDGFPERQSMNGYFLSQEGEWDSNGEALWAMDRYCALTGLPAKPDWTDAILRGARWIAAKRIDADATKEPAGLFPAGFSAEHLGLNDYYYWDDFWGVAGLRAAARMLEGSPILEPIDHFGPEGDEFLRAIEQHHAKDAKRLGRPAIPAAPNRRLDGGAIGSIVAGYPLQLLDRDDPRLRDTVAFLMERYFHNDAFLHHVGHSGYNAYLTLHVAQVLLHAGNTRFLDLMRSVADLASPTGHWPEAIHPRTGGGCMGDGQHVWAAAEWVTMLRNCFVLEEPASDTLVLGAGITNQWLDAGTPMSCGPTPTPWGPVTVRLETKKDQWRIEWDATWRGEPPKIEVRLPGREVVRPEPDQTAIALPEMPQ